MQQSDLDYLKQHYFSEPEKHIRLKAGETLLEAGQKNRRLFLVCKGKLVGSILDEKGVRAELFQSGVDKFVAAYSFFTQEHKSYSTVVAVEDSELAFLQHDDPVLQNNYAAFAEHLLPIVAEELYARQLTAQKFNQERQEMLERLHKTEKLALLGQMAAGLAHELNNAIGVLQQKTDWLVERITNFMAERSGEQFQELFKKGLERGMTMSTSEERKHRRTIEKQFDLNPREARKIARTGLTSEELRPFAADFANQIPRIQNFYELGLALHDMRIASKHAAEVIRSVKELGAINREHLEEVQLNDTIHQALALLKSVLRPVHLKLQLAETLPKIQAMPSDFVQIWINLIKNACEAMQSAAIQSPKLTIKSEAKDNAVVVHIIDNGPGIPDAILPHIFQPNFTTKEKGLSFGLGLGLPTVQKLVESYLGTIEVESKPGQTAFQVQIPVQ